MILFSFTLISTILSTNNNAKIIYLNVKILPLVNGKL